MGIPEFAEKFGQVCESLCTDAVPNIRIWAAKLVKKGMGVDPHYWGSFQQRLAQDEDGDVHFETLGRYKKQRGLRALQSGLGICALTPVV